jgi:hypothetical protein
MTPHASHIERTHRIINLARSKEDATTEGVARSLDRAHLEAMFVTAVDVITCMDYALLSAGTTRQDLVDIAHGRRTTSARHGRL